MDLLVWLPITIAAIFLVTTLVLWINNTHLSQENDTMRDDIKTQFMTIGEYEKLLQEKERLNGLQKEVNKELLLLIKEYNIKNEANSEENNGVYVGEDDNSRKRKSSSRIKLDKADSC